MIRDLVPEERRGEILRAGIALIAVLVFLKSISDWWTNRLAHRVVEVLEERGKG